MAIEFQVNELTWMRTTEAGEGAASPAAAGCSEAEAAPAAVASKSKSSGLPDASWQRCQCKLIPFSDAPRKGQCRQRNGCWSTAALLRDARRAALPDRASFAQKRQFR